MKILFVAYIFFTTCLVMARLVPADRSLDEITRKRYVASIIATMNEIEKLPQVATRYEIRKEHPKMMMIELTTKNFSRLQRIAQDVDFRIAILCLDPAGWEMLDCLISPLVLNFLIGARAKRIITQGTVLWKFIEYFDPLIPEVLLEKNRQNSCVSLSQEMFEPIEVNQVSLDEAISDLSCEIFGLNCLSVAYLRILEERSREAWSLLRQGVVSLEAINSLLLSELMRVAGLDIKTKADIELIRNLLRLKKMYVAENVDEEVLLDEDDKDFFYDDAKGKFVHVDEKKPLEELICEVILPYKDESDGEGIIVVLYE